MAAKLSTMTLPNFKRPVNWKKSSLGSESCLHQLSPYIGKLKTTIATALIEGFTKPGDLILEPFSGSGVVALEAARLKRNVIASDISRYAAVLTRAKLNAPQDKELAIRRAMKAVRRAKSLAAKKSYRTDAPLWVRSFFHPKTLRETKALCDILKKKEDWFLLACILGILHHQRPGFLSYPSSHLVPYLRTKRFPKEKFPTLYAYRDVEPRLIAKIERAYRRFERLDGRLAKRFIQRDVRKLDLAIKADAVITSPPYMNALDYGRDNRLRLWFLGADQYAQIDSRNEKTPERFARLMRDFARIANKHVKKTGKAILVVGEVRRGNRRVNTNEIVSTAFQSEGWRLMSQTLDRVPDIRRSRRDCRGTKREWIMVFAKRRK